MKCFQSLVVVALTLLFSSVGYSRATFKTHQDMIKTADVIAVVEITKIESSSMNGKIWTYQQKASAKVKKILKGKLAGSVSLYGDENFICARCRFEKGEFLVFLDYDKHLLTGNNWQYSARKINNGEVNWFSDNNSFQDKIVSLRSVLDGITYLLRKS